MLVRRPTTSTSGFLDNASNANALSFPPLQLRTTEFFTKQSSSSAEGFQRLSVRHGSRRPWYPMLGGARLVHAKLAENPFSPLVEDFVECRNHDERQQRRRNYA